MGKEAANVGAMLALNDDDLLTSNHRGHGQAIAKGIDLNGMMAEIKDNLLSAYPGKRVSMIWNEISKLSARTAKVVVL